MAVVVSASASLAVGDEGRVEGAEREQVALRRVYEACRTRMAQTGKFPLGYRDLEGLLSARLRAELPAGVVFNDMQSERWRLARESPVGERTPYLRMQVAPDRWLNVACSGWIYESREYWESEFVNLMPRPYMDPELLKLDTRPISARAIARSEKCGLEQVDLVSRCNAIPTTAWFFGPRDDGEVPPFAGLIASGVFEAGGVVFDARGAIQLDGMLGARKPGSRYLRSYPRRVDGIEIHQRSRSICILAGTVGTAPNGALVATLRLSFEGGRKEDVPLKYGEHLAAAGENATRGQKLFPREGESSLYSLYRIDIANPHSEMILEETAFISGESPSHPFLLAITMRP